MIVTAAAVTVLAVLSAIEAYPLVGGGKRYSTRSWTAYPPVVYQPRSTRYASYYDAYVPDAADLYYAQDPYRVVQLPGGYYLPDQYYPPEQYYLPEQHPEQYYLPEQHPEQYYYSQYEDDESLPDAEDELPDSSWYNPPDSDANAIFLQNLVMAQLYRDAASRNQRYPTSPYLYPRSEDYDEDGATYVYGEKVNEAVTAAPKEDKDVRDLKSLVDAGKQRSSAADSGRIDGKQRRKTDGGRKSLEENRWVNKRMDDDAGESAQESPKSAEASTDKKDGGQDEVVMMRPAVPVRTAKFHQRSYQPSAYDAIKKLLIQQNNEKDRQPQKRSYVLNEDSLVEQLGKLKKSS